MEVSIKLCTSDVISIELDVVLTSEVIINPVLFKSLDTVVDASTTTCTAGHRSTVSDIDCSIPSSPVYSTVDVTTSPALSISTLLSVVSVSYVGTRNQTSVAVSFGQPSVPAVSMLSPSALIVAVDDAVMSWLI